MSVIEQKLDLILEQVALNAEAISRLEIKVDRNTKAIFELAQRVSAIEKKLEATRHELLDKLASKTITDNHELRIIKLEKNL